MSVDAFKKSKPGRGRGQGTGRGYGRGRGGGRGSYQHRSQSGYRHTSSGRQGKCGNCGTSHAPRQCPAYGQNCYTCGKTGHYSRYCRSKHRSSTPGRRSCRDMHDVEPDEEYEYDTIQIIRKVKFSSSCHKEHNSNKNNVMFDEIADVPKRNLRMLSDLYAQSSSRKDTIRFKLDTGTGGNMLPYDTWKEFFPGQSSTALAKTIDKGMTLQAYNKSEIRQLGTCNLKISHKGATRTCHFFIVPSQYRSILGLNDLMALNLVTFNCPTTTSWSSSRTSTSIDTVTCDSVNQTIDIKRPLTLTDVIDNPKYKHLFQGVGKFKIKPVDITLKEGAIPYQSPPRRVPVALQDPFIEELGRMECRGTITKLDKSIAPEWLNSFVITHRQGSPNLPLHICLDLTPLNDAIVRPIK